MNSETAPIKKLTPMMQQYFDVKSKHQDYILMYRMGDFYELFFEDATISAQVLNIALTHRGTYDEKPIPMCGIPFHAFSSYIPKLVKQGFKVAICDQVEDPAEAKKRGPKSVVKREVTRIITAGTLTEDNLLNDVFNNYLMAVSFKDGLNEKISVALADISTGEFFIKSFEENPLSELLSFTMVKNPAEIIINNDLLENKKLEEFIRLFKSKLVFKPAVFFDLENANKNLKNIFNVQDISVLGSFSDMEIEVQGAVLNYIQLTQIGKIPNILKPYKELNSDVLQIDAFSVKNLEIFENITDSEFKNANLFSTMDRGKTPMGRRLLKSLLSSPLANVEEINRRLNKVEFFVDNQELLDEVREILSEIFDVQRIISRVSFNRAGPRDLLNLSSTLRAVPNIKNLILKKVANVLDNPLIDIIEALGDFEELAQKIEKAIVEEPPIIIREGGFVKEGFHPVLDEYKKLSHNTKQVILELQAKYSLDTSILNLKIKYNNIAGYFIEVPTAKAAPLLEATNTFKHKQTLVNGVRFTTDELSQIEQKILVANDKSLALELSIFEELSKEILERSSDISKLSEAVAKLDVFSSLGLLAIENNYVKPEVNNSLDFEIKDGRHPVVEAQLKSENVAFIPNSSVLENKGDDSKLCILP